MSGLPLLRQARRILPALLLLAGSSLHGLAADVRAIARATDEHYNHIKTLKAQFSQTYQGPGVSRAESGTLWLKKPGRMRWEYSQPRRKLFLSDSQTAYFYVPGERQARKASVKQLDDIRSPLRYLLGKTKLEKELDGLSLAPDVPPTTPGNMVLRGIPKGMKDRISEILLEVSPGYLITRMLIRETDGTTTDFRFSGQEEDLPMPESLFRFVPPPGVEIIKQEEISQ
jgi:outer membrane lipoprotein carrier protein